MNIAILTGTYTGEKCGVGDYAAKLFEALNQYTTYNYILISSKRLIEKKDIIQTIKITWSFLSFINIHKLLKIKDCNAVIFQFPTRVYYNNFQVVFLIFFLRVLGYKTMTILHEYGYSPWYAKLRSFPIILASHQLVVVDDIYKKQLNWLVKNKTKTIHIASNIPMVILRDGEKNDLRSLENTHDAILLCYFGFINESKGFEKILEILVLAKKEQYKFKLKIIGLLDEQNPYHSSLLKYIHVNDLKNLIIFTGYIEPEEVSRQIAISDYILLPFVKGLSPRNGSFWAAYQNKVKIITTKSEFSETRYFSNTYFIPTTSIAEEWLNCILKNKDNIIEDPQSPPNWESIANQFELIIKKKLAKRKAN